MRLSICFVVESVEFTASVIAGTTSLGGSESACLGLARALQARGHRVTIFTSKFGADAPHVDHAGVTWEPTSAMAEVSLLTEWDVMVALRMPACLGSVPAKFRVLWNQDLMSNEAMKQHVMGQAWAFDAVAYVSEYHRHQWETLIPELKPIGWVTKNGYDASLVPASATKRPNRIIHISRPERGLQPILAMWPALKAAEPDAELALCRYSSMYDKDGWGKVCDQFDDAVAAIDDQVGGITWLGELGKPALYQAIAEAAVMWYPGVSDFAETSCIAAIEAQACGTPFVGSFKGALPETVPGGVLVKGVAESDEGYHAESIQAVRYALDGCRRQTSGYRQVQQAGRQHVEAYTYDVIAAEWETFLLASFQTRYDTQKAGVLARLVYEDDLMRAQVVARELGDTQALGFIDRVAAGTEHTADDYAAHALSPLVELSANGPRLRQVIALCEGKKRIVDLACGNGTFALGLAQADPDRHVTAVDFSPANIEAARAAAAALGLSDQVTFICAPVWDFVTQAPSDWLLDQDMGQFDALWCGEFIEHVAETDALVEAVECLVEIGGICVWSCPFGPVGSLAPRNSDDKRSHVHRFHAADIEAIFGQKADLQVGVVLWHVGATQSPEPCGQWLFRYTTGGPTGARTHERRILTRPYATLTAGIITNDTLDLRRCLSAVWEFVDAIVIGDTGAHGLDLARIVEEFPRKTRVVSLGPVPDMPGGFSEARNRVLREASTDWFFWVDTDEVLVGGREIAKYREALVYQGFAIKQAHLQLDSPSHHDWPVRLFRRVPTIQFYGCVHEQPQMGDCNGDILPCLRINDIQIAHTGYLHEGIRRDKALRRNLPLLVRDQEMFPERELGALLVMRDYANLALWSREQARGAMSPAVRKYQALVIGLFEERFMDPWHRYHALARPFYESALRDVAGALEVEIGIAGAQSPHGLNGTPLESQRVWVRTPGHLRSLLAARTEAMIAPLETPHTMDVEPLPVLEAVH